MNVLQELVGDEVVAGEPDEVGQKDEKCEENAQPKPAARKVAARGGEDQAGEKASDKEDYGVFGDEGDADAGTDRDPPARVFGFEQADSEPAGEDPP